MTASITKKMIQAYEVRNDGEFGNVSIEEISYSSFDNDRHACRVMITSSFGDYGYFWSHCGGRGKKFLTHMSMDYAMGKFMGSRLDVFDFDATIIDMKKPLLEEVRKRDINPDLARAFWDAIKNIESERPDNENMFVLICREQFDEIDTNDDRFSEPWHYTKKKYDPAAVGFWNTIWLPLMDELRAELEVEQKEKAAADAARQTEMDDECPF